MTIVSVRELETKWRDLSASLRDRDLVSLACLRAETGVAGRFLA